MSHDISRRAFVVTTLGGAAWTLARCGLPAEGRALQEHLTARPHKPKATIAPGLHGLGLGTERDGQLYIPASYKPEKPVALVLALHGATQSSDVMINRLTALADATGAALLAPDSRGMTWDAIRGDFGIDVEFLDRTLNWVFDRVAIDPKRVILAGFSDGASYGLSLGMANGDLFQRVMAFSPGFVVPIDQARGKPAIYVSHGLKDQILPIDACSRRIVPVLKRSGYDVRFDEFDGGHGMPAPIVKAAGDWMMK